MTCTYAFCSAGLANRLLNAINLYAISLDFGWKFRPDALPEMVHLCGGASVLPSFNYAFEKPLGQVFERIGRSSPITSSLLCARSGDGPALKRPSRWCFGLWFNAWSYVEKHEEAVRLAFSADAELSRKAQLENGRWIGLHVRRGDYASWMGGVHYYAWEDYDRIAREYVHERPDCRLLVSSNETPPEGWLEGVEYQIAPDLPIVALYSLSNCELIVGPPSTFSLWASWIGRAQLSVIRAGEADRPRPVTLDWLSHYKA